MKIGSLFAGYGGLDLAVEQVFPDAAPAWFCEWDDAPSKVLAHHWPDVPNHRDVTAVDWAQVEPVDILTGGYPCQPFSHAGRRQGVNDERHLWPHVADALAVLRPRLAVFENVRGHLSLGFDEVLRDLKQLDYSARWVTIRAADVGAAHGRARLFILAEDNRSERPLCGGSDRRGGVYRNPAGGRYIPTPTKGVHVRQGAPRTACDEVTVRREDLRRQGCDDLQAGLVHMGTDGGQGWGSNRATIAPPIGEAPGSGCGIGVQAASSIVGALAPTWPTLDAGGSGSRFDAAISHTRSESSRPGPCPASAPVGNGTDGDLSLGLVVGAERRPVRAGGVPGEVADQRDDDRGPRLRGHAAADDVTLLPTPAVNDMGASYTPGEWDAWTARMKSAHGNGNGHGKSLSIEAQRLLSTPQSRDYKGVPADGFNQACLVRDVERSSPQEWGEYAPAIARWESTIGRPAPPPTEPREKGNPRLSPRFVEWLMGLPAGHVTDPAIGLTRNQQLKALGNGVVPAQGAAAIRHLLAMTGTTRLEAAA